MMDQFFFFWPEETVRIDIHGFHSFKSVACSRKEIWSFSGKYGYRLEGITWDLADNSEVLR